MPIVCPVSLMIVNSLVYAWFENEEEVNGQEEENSIQDGDSQP